MTWDQRPETFHCDRFNIGPAGPGTNSCSIRGDCRGGIFRDRGLNVMLMMDSVTRFAMAQREVGLAAGEPPSTKGYTPSVFSLLPRLFERAGKFQTGSITAFYTVLVEGDDMNDPIADSVRSTLDGHIVLDRELASRGHYPCIDVLSSNSRLMSYLADDTMKNAAYEVRDLLATHHKSEDLINIGAYKRASTNVSTRQWTLHDCLVPEAAA
jgi:flagellum-specific ATP synthase